jgi:hypothetical protein
MREHFVWKKGQDNSGGRASQSSHHLLKMAANFYVEAVPAESAPKLR